MGERSDIVPPSIMKGGHSGGVVKGVLALVEFEDGSVGEVYPHKIKFLDNPFIDYCFDTESNDTHIMELIEQVLDTLVEAGNGVTNEMLHEAENKLFKVRDMLELRPKREENK